MGDHRDHRDDAVAPHPAGSLSLAALREHRDEGTAGDHVPLGGDWALWRDFAVRSAGFPVSGLEVFGAGDEGPRLSGVAADPLFREAIAWQNRQALVTQVDPIARGASQSLSKKRRREAVVANYWQRYCAKNDMIGFFGPLAWGRIRDDGPAVAVRSRGLVADRQAHFETWCADAIAQQVAPGARVPLRLRPEAEIRQEIETLGDPAARRQALEVMDRVEALRDAVGSAPPDRVVGALDAFDAAFREITGALPVRPDGAAGGRSALYLDCTRDLDMDVGPALVQELSVALPPFLDSSRWYCSRSFRLGAQIVAQELSDAAHAGPLGPHVDRVLSALRALPQLLQADLAELQQRWRELLADGLTSGLPVRAASAFADTGPGWPGAIYQSPDIQIAAGSVDDLNEGRFLAVLGDFHPANALLQGMFAERHPDPSRLLRTVHADLGSPLLYVIPRRTPGIPIDARIVPSFTSPDDIHVALAAGDRGRPGFRTISADDLLVDGEDCTDRAGSFRAPVAHLFAMPMFLAAMHTFDPFPVEGGHGDRITFGRTVLRRETWAATAGTVPRNAADFSAWARGREMPRRLFCRPPGEAKPVYVDLDSTVLVTSLHRMLQRVADAEPEVTVRFAEMLPDPDGCWLAHGASRFTSELRLVAVDLSRRGTASVWTRHLTGGAGRRPSGAPR